MPKFRNPHCHLNANVLFPIPCFWNRIFVLGLVTIGLSLISCSHEPKASSELVSSKLRSTGYEGTTTFKKPPTHELLTIQKSQTAASRPIKTKIHTSPAMIKVDIERLLVAREVKKRRAIGEAIRFPSNIGAIWSFAQVYAQGGTAELEIRWWYNATKVSVNPFLVAEGLRWREWSKVTIKPNESGQWKVDVYDRKQKEVLASHTFTIDPPILDKKIHKDPNSSSKPISASAQEQNANMPLSPPQNREWEHQDYDRSFLVNRFEIARTIKRRRPLGTDRRFSLSDERLWGYIEVSNSEGPKFVWMEWYRGDTLRSRLKIRVGISKRWRTWSWQRLSQRDQGQWSVKVLSDSGRLLAQTHFSVDP